MVERCDLNNRFGNQMLATLTFSTYPPDRVRMGFISLDSWRNMPLYDLERSTSLEVLARVRKKISAGETVYSLAIGEPVFDTPPEIIEAAVEGMKKRMTHYVSSLGIPEVRSAIVRKVERKNKIACEERNTIFMSGKMAIYAIYMALDTGMGDEILVPDPGYFYTEPAVLAGVKAVPYYLNEDYSLNLDEIEGKITPRTRAVVINTPSNPTGRVYPREDLKKLLDLCKSKGISLISDEAYEDLTYDTEHVSIGSLEYSPDTVISLFTLSKSYAMTGWRAGYIIAEQSLIRKLRRYMDQAVTCFPPFVQYASAYALDNMDLAVEEFQKDFRKKRDFVVGKLKLIPGMKVNPVEGAFYIFPEYGTGMPSKDVASRLIEEHNVAVLPGIAFGSRGEGHIRISYSGSMESLEIAMERLAEFFSS